MSSERNSPPPYINPPSYEEYKRSSQDQLDHVSSGDTNDLNCNKHGAYEQLDESVLDQSTIQPTIADSDRLRLEPTLGLFSSVNLIVGCVIGSGIFLSPTYVLKQSGSIGMSLIVWTMSGVFTLIGALCFAEIGSTIPKSGAEYAYVLEAFGGLPAFIVLYVTLIMIYPATGAIVGLTCSQYVIEAVMPGCEPSDAFIRLGALLCISKYM